MKSTYIYLSLLTCFSLSIQAMNSAKNSDNNNNNNSNNNVTFNDQSRFYAAPDGEMEITPEVLEFLGPQIPEDARAAFYQFIYQNPGFFETLTKFEPLNWQQNYNAGVNALSAKNITNLSPRKTSYIFPLPTNKNYFVQMSSPYHKLFNLSSAAQKGWTYCAQNYARGLKLEELKEFTGQPTYQTVSRKAFYLAFKRALAQIKAETGQEPKVSTSDTYLLPIGQGDYFPASDSTHVVLQAAYDTTQLAHIRRMDSENKWDKMASAVYAHRASDEAIRQFCDVIAHAKLFDTEPNLLVDCLNGNLHQADLEQPNDESPLTFFHKLEPKYANDVWEGLRKFKGIFTNTEQHDKAAIVNEAIKNNKELKSQLSEQSYARIMKLTE